MEMPTFTSPFNTNNLPQHRSSLILPAPPWRGSAVLPPSNIYETPTTTPSWDDDEYSIPEPDPYSDETWYPLPTATEPSTPPHPSYSAIVTVRTTTWVVSRSTTITSILLETYYSTLTDYDGSAEGGTVTVATSVTETESGSASDPCAGAASGGPSKYASGCSSSGGPVTTITWTPALTAYPLPSSSKDEGRAPASTSTTSSAPPSTTTSTPTTTETDTETESPTGTSTANESPPVVTGAAAPLHSTNTRVFAAAAALFAVLA
ncbi:hypothetical protein CCMA1212_008263 [Trichoderma ghanense]|uniref:Uncharacterized protein n=1 Tax=Trichoderma ghanense TaxID=65468 RepID=A0ABY2GW41_9HYPO